MSCMLDGAGCCNSGECAAYQCVSHMCNVEFGSILSIIKPIHVDSNEIAFIHI